uniref:Uncharacterized protein n=1 Tax=Tanacetum cinerariifolium TaxID=118510 RepID=A0A6L2P4B9_TANCI|nr:hypothetical protein [Tanacetum cinerariifolium]
MEDANLIRTLGDYSKPSHEGTPLSSLKGIIWYLFDSKPSEEEKDVVNNRAITESIVEPSKSEEEEPPKIAYVKNKVERRADDELTKSVRENVTKNKEEEATGPRIPEPHRMIEKRIKNDIEPIAPMMIVNRLVLEWEEKIKLHQEKEMKFDQWRSKIFKNERPTLVTMESEVANEGEVT